MVARFSGCVVVIHWLPHAPVQIFFGLVLVHKKVWCFLSSLSIQTGVLTVTFHITLLYRIFINIESFDSFCSDEKGERYGKSSFCKALGKAPNKKNFEISS